MIIEMGSFQVAIDVDTQSAVFEGLHDAVAEVPATGKAIVSARRAVVEVRRAVGGLPQLAMLGGRLDEPTARGRFTVDVALSGMTSTGPASYRGYLGSDLIPGLPDEFGGAILAGILERTAGPGHLTIDRGAYHPVESSRVAFSLAGSLLTVVLGCDGPEEIETRVRETLKSSV